MPAESGTAITEYLHYKAITAIINQIAEMIHILIFYMGKQLNSPLVNENYNWDSVFGV